MRQSQIQGSQLSVNSLMRTVEALDRTDMRSEGRGGVLKSNELFNF